MHLGYHIRFGGEVDHRDLCRLHDLHQLKTVFAGQHDIQESESIFRHTFPFVLFREHCRFRLFPVINGHRIVSGGLQVHADQLGNRRIILYHQYFRFHVQPMPFNTVLHNDKCIIQ